MTRAERLAHAEARAKARLDAQRSQLATVQAQRHAEAQKALTKRRYAVGKLVLDTPLATLDDATLGQLFTVLSALTDVPDPLARLAHMLGASGAVPVVPGNGCAVPAERVSTAC